MREKSVSIRKYQSRSIYSYVTLVTAQNDLHPSVSNNQFTVDGEVVFARGVNKHEGGS
jgi:hypothetical protein